MSLKRKAELTTAEASQKKSKTDFFAPRKPANTSSGPALSFPAKDNGDTRLTTWNVNGIKSMDKKILEKYVEAENPDIIILTETKSSDAKPDVLCLKARFCQVSPLGCGSTPRPRYPTSLTSSPSFISSFLAGTAVLSKIKPLGVTIGLPTWPDAVTETSGPYVEVEFDHVYVVGTYVPNSGDNFKSMNVKQKWNAALNGRLRELDSKKPIIWAGDFNCIPTKNDVDAKAEVYWDKMSGLSQIERSEFDALLNPADKEHTKLADVWRHLHSDAREFTHSSVKYGAWRLDSFIVSDIFPTKSTH